MSNDINQTVVFKTTPHEVYEALMDSKKHAAFSGGAAKISRAVGGEMMAYDGYISGKNIELVPDKRSSKTGAPWIGPKANSRA